MKKGITVLMIVLCMACLTFSLLACDGNGDTTPNLPDGDTVVISGEYQPPIDHDNDYDDEDVDYSQAVVIEGTTLTELTEYGKTLSRIVIPEGVTNIGSYAFVFCTSLTSVVIPSSVTSIGDFAFRDCISLTSIVLPSSVTSIGDGAFYRCSSLTSIVIPSGVASIGNFAFSLCFNLTSVEIPSSVTSIGSSAFYSCSNLTSIEIPSSVTSIGDYPFVFCSSLVIKCEGSKIDALTDEARVVLGDENNNMYYYAPVVSNYKSNEIADDGYIYVVADNGIQYALKDGIAKVSGHSYITGDVAIASKVSYKGKVYQVTKLDNLAFFYALYINSIDIPSSVTSIGDFAFATCASLTRIEIPSGVTSIGSQAFQSCSSLTSIEIPSSVTSICENVFRDCSSLTIYCEAESQPSGWDSRWNSSNRPVVWSYKTENR